MPRRERIDAAVAHSIEHSNDVQRPPQIIELRAELAGLDLVLDTDTNEIPHHLIPQLLNRLLVCHQCTGCDGSRSTDCAR
jgi:hypothetical protein